MGSWTPDPRYVDQWQCPCDHDSDETMRVSIEDTVFTRNLYNEEDESDDNVEEDLGTMD